MVDYEAIGKRIAEQRKCIWKKSQTLMADEISMHQADISNLENAKNGSGISDLHKLELIADYFSISLQYLIFGSDPNERLGRYYGRVGDIKHLEKARKEHIAILRRIVGSDFNESAIVSYKCGAYCVYFLFSQQIMMLPDSEFKNGEIENGFPLAKTYAYVFGNNEVIASMAAALVYVDQILHPLTAATIQEMIQIDHFSIRNVVRTLNPYMFLIEGLLTDERNSELIEKSDLRLKQITEDEERLIVFVESIYVKEERRRRGICRLILDALRMTIGDQCIWINLEPTSGEELDNEARYFANYTQSQIGQMNLNASIAEKLGFKIDQHVTNRQVDTVGENGKTDTDIVEIRKHAYCLSKALKGIVRDDGDLVSLGIAKDKVSGIVDRLAPICDIRQQKTDEGAIVEIRQLRYSGEVFFITAILDKAGTRIYYVTKLSMIDHGMDVEKIETYSTAKNAYDSEFATELRIAGQCLLAFTSDHILSDDEFEDI